MNESKKWIKSCPNCGNEQSYTTKGNLAKSIKNNIVCMDCRNKHLSEITKGRYAGEKNYFYGVRKCGKDNQFYGKKHTDETKKAHSTFMTGKYVGKDNAFFGKKHSDETKKILSDTLKGRFLTDKQRTKIRVGIQRYREENGLVGFVPNFNPDSIHILEQIAKELGITDLQHAENGGEFHIKELGYWVDGYSKEKNIVIEYDEKRHFTSEGKLKERDVIRQTEIENYLGCTFIRITE